MSLFKNSRGDTIVEVMIAIAIAGSVMGGAYVVTNKILANSRQAQEHTEALQIANEQIERIIGFAATSNDSLYDTTEGLQHCANKDTGALENIPDPNTIPAGCKGFGLGQLCTVTFTYEPENNEIFRIKVVWDSAARETPDQVSLTYRPYKS